MPLNLYNTRAKAVEPFVARDPAHVTFYTCGPTVYDDAHIGNFRSFLAADLLRRFLESPLCTILDEQGTPHQGPRTVTHVMNITDVGHMTDDDSADGSGEDKMDVAKQRLLEAKKAGTLPQGANVDPTDPRAIADFYTDRFLEDARALGLKVAIEQHTDPTRMPRATDHIQGMQGVIARLLDTGHAYTSGEPGSRAVYFDVQSFKDYGKLSGNTLDQLRGGAGGRVDDSNQQSKKHPADFLLWKEDESHTMKWDAPDHDQCAGWSKGYPGWHIECTAMALERLVEGGLAAARDTHAHIDIHSGGEDNIFPHHECEIAQSCCFTESGTFATHWFHPRFLMVDGAKMSKSKGTFHTPRQLIAQGIDPAAIRLELIKTHYRANADFSMQGLKDSARTVSRWRTFLAKAQAAEPGHEDDSILIEVRDALADDLNIAGAIGAINAWIKRTPEPSKSDARALETIDQILGVLSLAQTESKESESGIAIYKPGVIPSDEIESLLTQRADAKKSKDFAKADQIRDTLTAMGLVIMDKPGGKVEVAPLN
jgi:cysteinyl-tRNA synthetase